MSKRRFEQIHLSVTAAAALASMVVSLLVGCDLIKRERTSGAKTSAPQARSGGAATVGVKIGPGPAVATTDTTATSEAATQPPAPERSERAPAATASTTAPAQQPKSPAQSVTARPASGKAPSGATTNPTPRPKLHLITYVDGGDRDRNDTALAIARKYLAGARHVAIHGSGDPKLTAELRDYFRNEIRTVSLSEHADVVIDFMGRVDHAGRKRRTAIVTVSRDDMEIFHYELGPEEYRVGDDPAEAFARVASDLFER